MIWPLVPNPLGGNLGAFTCSVFRLDPATGTIPLEPVADIVPGVTPLRVTFDVVDSESASFEYDVTEHAVQSFFDVTTNVHKRLETITVTGLLSANLPFVSLPIGTAPSLPFGGPFLRLDLMRARHLKQIADARQPVMVVTPRVGMPRAFITSLQQQWSPADGESTVVSITFKEARFVSPLTGFAVEPDAASSSTGNNSAYNAGQQAGQAANVSAAPSGVTGVAPTVSAASPGFGGGF